MRDVCRVKRRRVCDNIYPLLNWIESMKMIEMMLFVELAGVIEGIY
jgi:hypothetical protein